MRRYWKVISISFFIVLIIGTFYMQAGIASSKNPSFYFKKVSGDAEEVKKLTVYGELHAKDQIIQDSLQINDTETIYASELSFIESLNHRYLSFDIKRLQRDYRSFMRAKTENINLYFEDKTYVAYADINWEYNELDHSPSKFMFNIDILNKQSGENIVMSEPVPIKGKYDYINVEDVQVADGKLKVAASIYPVNRDMYQGDIEIHVYTFDIDSKRLIGDDKLSLTGGKKEKDANTWTELRIINDSEKIEPQTGLLIAKVKLKEVPYEDGVTTKDIAHKYMFYNYETRELKEVGKENQDLNFETVSLYGSVLYFMNTTADGLDVYPYHLANGKFLKKHTFPMKMAKKTDFPIIKLKNNKFYIVNPSKDENDEASILIADVKTRNILYEGIIEERDKKKALKENSLNIYTLDVE